MARDEHGIIYVNGEKQTKKLKKRKLPSSIDWEAEVKKLHKKADKAAYDALDDELKSKVKRGRKGE